MAGTPSTSCPTCGEPQLLRARFCGSCGATLPEELLASLPDEVPQPAAPTPASAARKSQTLFGMAPPTPAPAPAPPTPEVPRPAGAPVANQHATIFGMPAPGKGAPAPAAPAPSGQGAAFVANQHATMMGVPVSGVPQAPQPPPPTAPDPRPTPSRTERAPLYDLPAPPLSKPPPPPAPAPAPAETWTSDSLSLPGLSRKERPRWVLPVGVVALALLVGGGAAALLRRPTTELVSADGRAEADGTLRLRVHLGEGFRNAQVRSGFVTAAADAQGDATLALPLTAEQVGSLEFPLEIRGSDGALAQRRARVVLAWRASPELVALGENPPRLRVSFRAPAGATLELQGQRVGLDAQGRGTASVALENEPAAEPPTRSFPLPLRVQLQGGAAVTDQLTLTVPRVAATLQRPPADALTSAERVSVVGRAANLSGATINGQAATVQGDTFTAEVAVPVGRTELSVVVRGRDALPMLLRRTVTRVAGNDPALARFRPPAGLTAPHLALPTIPEGSLGLVRARRVGDAYPREGASSWQLVSEDRGCPEQRCLFWLDTEPGVTLPADRTLTLLVRVTGRRAWVTSSGERRQDTVLYPAWWQEGP